jgi:hypothetical protein
MYYLEQTGPVMQLAPAMSKAGYFAAVYFHNSILSSGQGYLSGTAHKNLPNTKPNPLFL